jgi:hypothetical protein
MLNSILKSLAELLAGGTLLTSTERVDFSHPSNQPDNTGESSLNLYLYDVRISKKMPNTGRQVERSFDESQPFAEIQAAPKWFDVSILITARDRTVLEEHQLLSDVLSLLMRYQRLREEFLTPDLRGYGSLPLSVIAEPPIDAANLWSSFSQPIRPAVYLTVTVPLSLWRKTAVPLVTERQFGVNDFSDSATLSRRGAITRRVAIAGIVRNVYTSKPLRKVRVLLQETEKMATSDQEGYFFFENVASGSYALQFKRFGYRHETCSVLVTGEPCIPREIFLTPSL